MSFRIEWVNCLFHDFHLATLSYRIAQMDQVQYPGPNVWFHIRINILFFFLWFIDVAIVCLTIESIMTNGIGAVVLFTSEVSFFFACLEIVEL